VAEQNDNSKLSIEEMELRLKEIHFKLSKQSLYYRHRATITLYLIFFVTIVGLVTFACPNIILHRSEEKYNKLIHDLENYQKAKDSLYLKR